MAHRSTAFIVIIRTGLQAESTGCLAELGCLKMSCIVPWSGVVAAAVKRQTKIMAGETIKTNLRSHSSSPRCIFGPTFFTYFTSFA